MANVKKKQIYKLPHFDVEEVLTLQEVKQKIGWEISAFNLPKIWDKTQGEGVKVAVVDSGCDLDHPDLVDNLLPGINFVQKGKPPEDDNQHGCVHPDTFVHTNFCGVERIQTLYDRINTPEIWHRESWIKDVRGMGLKTYSLDKETGDTKIGEIEFLHKTPVNSEIVEIELQGGVKLELTPWHPVYTKKRLKKNKYKVSSCRADKIKKHDGFIFPSGDFSGELIKDYFRAFGGDNKKCERCGHVCLYFKNINSPCKKCYSKKCVLQKNNYLLTEDLCYLIGLIITDGHLTIGKNYRVEIHSNTLELLEKSKSILEKYGFKSTIEIKKCSRLICNSKELTLLMKNVGIKHDKKSYEQDLPEFIGKSPKSAICSFLAGVIDGDGCISKSNTQNRITTVSQKFAHQLAYLLNSISISAGWQKYKNYGFSKKKKLNPNIPIYNCVFSTVSEEISKYLAHPIKIQRSKIVPKYRRLVRPVKNITKTNFNGFFYDFTVKDYNTYVANGHMVSNTHVTGIICASNNNLGMVGVAPKCKVMPVKVLDKKGAGDNNNVCLGIKWAVDNGADIISMSLGSPNPVPSMRKACQYAEKKGVPIFVAAGNAGLTKQIFYPANYPEPISIGSIDENFTRSTFSNTGENLDFMAPGGKIFSTVPDNWYAFLSGTSMATPFAVGVAALCLSYQRKHYPDKPLIGGDAYRNLFKNYTTPITDKEYANKVFFQGFGIIDPRKFETFLAERVKFL